MGILSCVKELDCIPYPQLLVLCPVPPASPLLHQLIRLNAHGEGREGVPFRGHLREVIKYFVQENKSVMV